MTSLAELREHSQKRGDEHIFIDVTIVPRMLMSLTDRRWSSAAVLLRTLVRPVRMEENLLNIREGFDAEDERLFAVQLRNLRTIKERE